MVTGFLCVGLALALALLVAIYLKLGALPVRMWAIAKEEQAREAGRGQAALVAAAGLKVGPLVKSIRDHEEQIAASFRGQLADAEVRARLVERRTTETLAILGAASTLVRELRAALDALGAPRAPRGAAPPEQRGADATGRPTLALARVGAAGVPAAAVEGEDPEVEEDELTRVGPRPRAAEPAGAKGAR
jgi:hypothetical protein